ncbi:Serine carboxypeptidase-like 49 [Linum grandiflorum]
MAKQKSFTLRVFLLLSLIVCSRAAEDFAAIAKSSFPSVQADKFIRDLNLFPKHDVNIIQRPDEAQSPTLKKLVEKPLRFPNLLGNATDDVSVEDLGHHAGYFNIEHSYAAKMFYFFFESRSSKEDPVVIWLTGGPGCSSELAIFYENGPFSIADNMSLVWNEFGWDQVEFSLQAFFTEHPELAKNDFYITGESYAGHYIPAFASRVHKGNKNNEGIHINLKGFAIGNGLTDPAVQYKAYPDFALENGIIKESQYKLINKVVPVCEIAIKLCGTDGTVSCMASYFVCNGIFNAIIAIAGNINYYDIRKQCVGSLCYDFSNMEKFLNQNNVRESLGVGDIDFVSCSPTVYEAMLVDWMRNLEVGIPELLEDGIKMLIYAGEYDLICNWLEWSGQKEFVSSPEISFEVDGSEAGVLKTHGPLAFLKVHNAGHMVPMDQPKAALEMLKRWTQGEISDAPVNKLNPEKLVAEF